MLTDELAWTGDLIGEMHNHKISRVDVANHIGVRKSYVGMILNGQRSPKGGKERLEKAVRELIAIKEGEVI